MSGVTADYSKAACSRLHTVWCKMCVTCRHQELISTVTIVVIVLELSGRSENAGLALILHVEVEILPS